LSGFNLIPSMSLILILKNREPCLLIYFYFDSNLMYYNGKRLPNGLVPTVSDVGADPSLTGNPSDLAAESDAATAPYLTEKWMKEIGDDIYKAHDVSNNLIMNFSFSLLSRLFPHQLALKEGLDDWSEWGYIHNKMGASLNATEYYTG
jgi:hypothetical protein